MHYPLLSLRCSVRLPYVRFHPLPSEPDVRISRIRLSSGIMPLAQRNTGSERSLTVPAAFALPRLPEAARLHPRCPSPTCRRACSRLGGTEPPNQPGPAPSLTHVMLRDSLPFRRDRRQSHSRGPSPLRHLSTPEAPFFDGRYPASSVLRASPPPCRPGLPLAGSRSPRARHRQGFPCCYAFHLPCMPAPIPRRKPAGALVALFPAGQRPSPNDRRVGFRIMRFEACSAFTRVPACMVAEPPIGSPSLQGASAHVVTSMNRPGRYQPERQLLGGVRTPQGKRAFPRRTVMSTLQSVRF